ncbi:histidine phosphatase family protein [Microbacterium phyllosphaerae]
MAILPTNRLPLAVLAAAAAVASLASCAPAQAPATDDSEPTTVTIYLTRHGETILNELDLAQGWADSPLVPSGEKDAEDLGEGLHEAGIDFELAYSADMVRHFDTAEIALRAADSSIVPERDQGLREIAFGRFEGSTNQAMWDFAAQSLGYADMAEMFADSENFSFSKALDAIAAGSDGTDLPAETSEELTARALTALEDIAEDGLDAGGGDILVVSSGITIMNVLGALGADLSGVRSGIDNAAVSKLVYEGGEWTVESVNDLSYVEAGAAN